MSMIAITLLGSPVHHHASIKLTPTGVVFLILAYATTQADLEGVVQQAKFKYGCNAQHLVAALLAWVATWLHSY